LAMRPRFEVFDEICRERMHLRKQLTKQNETIQVQAQEIAELRVSITGPTQQPFSRPPPKESVQLAKLCADIECFRKSLSECNSRVNVDEPVIIGHAPLGTQTYKARMCSSVRAVVDADMMLASSTIALAEDFALRRSPQQFRDIGRNVPQVLCSLEAQLQVLKFLSEKTKQDSEATLNADRTSPGARESGNRPLSARSGVAWGGS